MRSTATGSLEVTTTATSGAAAGPSGTTTLSPGATSTSVAPGSAELDPAWFAGAASVGVTSGASTPESSVQAVVARLREFGATSVEEVDGIPETVEFMLPHELR